MGPPLRSLKIILFPVFPGGLEATKRKHRAPLGQSRCFPEGKEAKFKCLISKALSLRPADESTGPVGRMRNYTPDFGTRPISGCKFVARKPRRGLTLGHIAPSSDGSDQGALDPAVGSLSRFTCSGDL